MTSGSTGAQKLVTHNETDFNKIISKFNKVKRNFGNI